MAYTYTVHSKSQDVNTGIISVSLSFSDSKNPQNIYTANLSGAALADADIDAFAAQKIAGFMASDAALAAITLASNVTPSAQDSGAVSAAADLAAAQAAFNTQLAASQLAAQVASLNDPNLASAYTNLTTAQSAAISAGAPSPGIGLPANK